MYRSSSSSFPVVRLARWTVLWLVHLFGCSSHPIDEPPSVTDRVQSLHQRKDTATTCPDGQRPTLSATSIGLTASKTYGPNNERSAVVDARCLVDPISFAVPASLPVTKGDAGKGRATLSFREASSARITSCEYRGTSKQHERSDRYDLHKCHHKGRAGETKTGDWFRLEIESAQSDAGTTEVRVVLGSSSPTTPVEIVSADARLGEAVLAIPPGAASPFEHFALEVVAGSRPSLLLNYGVKSSTAAAYGVRIRAFERGEGAVLAPSPSGVPFTLTMSYDPKTLTDLGATEKNLLVLEIGEIRPWSVPEILSVRTDFTVDTVNHRLTINATRAVGYLSVVRTGARRIPYNGGSVMQGRATVHFLYYGTVTAYQRTVLEDFVRDLPGTPWFRILETYDDSPSGRPTTDLVMGQTTTVPSPNANPTGDWVIRAVEDAVDQRRLPSDGNPMYFVIAGSDITIPVNDLGASGSSGNCGWHSAGSTGLLRPTKRYGLIKHTSLLPTCNGAYASFRTSPNRDKAVDGMVSVLAHEIVETLTNPDVADGWVTEFGGSDVENADNCAWQFAPQYTAFTDIGPPPQNIPANMKVGIRDFTIQQNWVNIGNGYGYCALRVENDDALFAGITTSLPEPPAGASYRPMIYGATYTADVEYQNAGDTWWRDAGAAGEQYLLGSQAPQDNDTFGVGGRVSPSGSVNPGSNHHFSFPFRATVPAMAPGTDYVFQWRMVREAVRWFGEYTPPIIVRAMFDSSVAVPGTVPSPQSDETFTVPVTFRNDSGAAWRAQDGYSLRVDPGPFVGGTRVEPTPGESIEPGASKTFSVPLTAPRAPGLYVVRAQMQHDGVGVFGPEQSLTILVLPSDRAVYEAQSVPNQMAIWSNYEVRATFRNTGTATWGPGYGLSVTMPLKVASVVPLDAAVEPGESYEFTATVTPDDFGNHFDDLPRSFGIQLGVANSAGRTFAWADPVLVQIRAPLEVLATCLDPGVPSVMVAGTTYRAKTIIKNRGETTWPMSFGLAPSPREDRTWKVSFVPLTQSIGPNETFTLEYDVVAPAVGLHAFTFMMAQGSAGEYIFDPCQSEVNVVATLADSATYLPNVPDVSASCTKQPMLSCYRQELLCFGRRFNVPVPVTMKNTGGTTWTRTGGYFLSVTDSTWGVTRVDLGDGEAIGPGESKTFSFNPVAPSTFGERLLQFQMAHDATLFGDETPSGIAQLVAGCGG